MTMNAAMSFLFIVVSTVVVVAAEEIVFETTSGKDLVIDCESDAFCCYDDTNEWLAVTVSRTTATTDNGIDHGGTSSSSSSCSGGGYGDLMSFGHFMECEQENDDTPCTVTCNSEGCSERTGEDLEMTSFITPETGFGMSLSIDCSTNADYVCCYDVDQWESQVNDGIKMQQVGGGGDFSDFCDGSFGGTTAMSTGVLAGCKNSDGCIIKCNPDCIAYDVSDADEGIGSGGGSGGESDDSSSSRMSSMAWVFATMMSSALLLRTAFDSITVA